MLFSFCDTLTFQREFPDMLGENYSPDVKAKIRDNAMAWLHSLPMVEYAHVMLVVAYHHLGGCPKHYLEILYNLLMQPVLRRYYRELEAYRLNRYLIMNHNWEDRKITPKCTANSLKNKLSYCTCRTRRALRYLCEQFAYLKDLDINDRRLQYFIAGVNELAENGDIVNWDESFEKLAVAMAERDFANRIAKISFKNKITNIIVKDKLNELCELYKINPIHTDDPKLDELKDKTNELIAQINVQMADSANTYKKLVEKINELIDSINNQKTRKI